MNSISGTIKGYARLLALFQLHIKCLYLYNFSVKRTITGISLQQNKLIFSLYCYPCLDPPFQLDIDMIVKSDYYTGRKNHHLNYHYHINHMVCVITPLTSPYKLQGFYVKSTADVVINRWKKL